LKKEFLGPVYPGGQEGPEHMSEEKETQDKPFHFDPSIPPKSVDVRPAACHVSMKTGIVFSSS
jgi:hypothetical protein